MTLETGPAMGARGPAMAAVLACLAGCGRADPEAARIAFGQSAYNARCAVCHGMTGQGEGRMARALKLETIIPNFRDTRALAGRPEAVSIETVRTGRTRAYRTRTQEITMPAFPDLSDEEIRAILAYVRTLPGRPGR